MKHFYKKIYYPLFISNLMSYFVFMIADMVDSVLAGNMIGEQAVSAVGLVTPLYTLICCVGYIFAEGAPILYQRKYGALKTENAYSTFGLMLIVNILTGVAFSIILLFIYRPFIVFYGAGPEITALAFDYFKFFPLVALMYPLYAIIYNMVFLDGDSKLCFFTTIAQMFSNIIVSKVLIGKLGIIGLGLGTATSILVSILVLSIHFLKKSNSVRFSLKNVEFKDIPKSVSTGVYMWFLYLVAMVVAVILNKYIIQSFGEMFIPAYSCMTFAVGLSLNFRALSVAAGPLISIYYGENNNHGILRMVKYLTKISFVIGVVSFVLIEIFAGFVPVIYGISTPELVSTCTMAVRIVAICFVYLPFHELVKIYYSYIGKSGLSSFFTLFSSGVFGVTLEIAISKAMGINGIWLGKGVAPLVTLIVAFIYIFIKYKKEGLPFIIKDNGNIYMFDDYISEDSIVGLRDAVGKKLRGANLEQKLIYRIELLIEEMLVNIKEKNPGKKILTELTLILGEDIRAIEKDTGVIFDITDTDGAITSFSSYILSALMERERDRMYTITTGYNRNSFSFKVE